MYNKDYLVERDGLMFVCSESSDYSEPKKRRLYYPVSNGYGAQTKVDSYNRQYIGEAVSYNRLGYYELARPMGTPIIVRLMNDGATVATIVEEEAISCPKVRKGIETRYRDGRWQKYLKSEGWANA